MVSDTTPDHVRWCLTPFAHLQDRVDALRRAGRAVLAVLTRLADSCPGPTSSTACAGRAANPGPTQPGGPDGPQWGTGLGPFAVVDAAGGGGVPAEVLRRLVRAVGPALTGTWAGPELRVQLEQARLGSKRAGGCSSGRGKKGGVGGGMEL